jgi:hypothetical protein
MKNTWPEGRQLCCQCDQPTGRCEDDAIYDGDLGPLCPDCVRIIREKEKA